MLKIAIKILIILALFLPATRLGEDLVCNTSRFFMKEFLRYCGEMKKPHALTCPKFTVDTFCNKL